MCFLFLQASSFFEYQLFSVRWSILLYRFLYEKNKNLFYSALRLFFCFIINLKVFDFNILSASTVVWFLYAIQNDETSLKS